MAIQSIQARLHVINEFHGKVKVNIPSFYESFKPFKDDALNALVSMNGEAKKLNHHFDAGERCR